MDPTQLGEAFQAMSMNPPTNDDQWHMDSGATDNLTGNSGINKNPLLSNSYGSIYVGNGQRIPILGSGHITLNHSKRPYI